jgi:hypothetical protein
MDLPPVSFNSTYQEHTFVAEVTRSFHPQVADLSLRQVIVVILPIPTSATITKSRQKRAGYLQYNKVSSSLPDF